MTTGTSKIMTSDLPNSPFPTKKTHNMELSVDGYSVAKCFQDTCEALGWVPGNEKNLIRTDNQYPHVCPQNM